MTNMLLNIMFVYLLWTGILMAILYGFLFGGRAAASFAVENGLAKAKRSTLVCAFLGTAELARLTYHHVTDWVNAGAPQPQPHATRAQS